MAPVIRRDWATPSTGIMLPNLKYKTDKEVILKWIHDGGDKKGYEDTIAPILNRDCVLCHTPSVNPSLPDLTNFEGVSEVALSGGASLPALVGVSLSICLGLLLFCIL